MPAAPAVRNAVLPASLPAIVSVPLIRPLAKARRRRHRRLDDAEERIGKRLVPSRTQVQPVLIDVCSLMSDESWVGVDERRALGTYHISDTRVRANNRVICDAAVIRASQKLAGWCERAHEDVSDSIFWTLADTNQL